MGAIRLVLGISFLTLARGLSGAALPVAFFLATRQKRRERAALRAAILEDDTPPDPASQPTRDLVHDLLAGGADLTGIDLRSAPLDRMDLRSRRLEEVDLDHASLREARLDGASLRGTRLRHADLSGASLVGADLSEVDLLEANLRKADLRAANLVGARHLVMANLRGASYDLATRWPRGFDPAAAGARRIGGGTRRRSGSSG